jgi:hypothetical protein
MLKIYKHINAQSQIKVKIGEDKDGKPLFEVVKFRDGRTLGTAKGVQGGVFHTTDEKLQTALESRIDFGQQFFIDHKISGEKIKEIADKEYRVFHGVDTINKVKNILKKEYADKVSSSDLIGPNEMLKFAIKEGVAFPDFFKADQGHFAVEEKAPEMKVVDEEVKIEEGFEEVEVDPDQLRAMSRKDLNAKAVEFGVENPDKLPNIEAVVQAILNQ